MGDKKNLKNEAAADKIKELAEGIDTCMFCTYNGTKLASRPMSVQQIDDSGNLWFLSHKRSNKNADISQNPTVELFFAKGHDSFLSIHGQATVLFDYNKTKELWNPIIKVWMPEGVDDPNLSIIKVVPEDGYYWNNKHGKMVAIVKMTAALLTGKTMDDGIEGNLEL